MTKPLTLAQLRHIEIKYGRKRGAVIVLFAVMAPLFMLCLFGSIHLAALGWTKCKAQIAADSAALAAASELRQGADPIAIAEYYAVQNGADTCFYYTDRFDAIAGTGKVCVVVQLPSIAITPFPASIVTATSTVEFKSTGSLALVE